MQLSPERVTALAKEAGSPDRVKEANIAQEEWDGYRRARDQGHESYMERAKECDNYYLGDQWTEEDKQALDQAGRPALTINQILPTVNSAMGEQQSRRADIRYKPTDGKATSELASVLTKTVNHVLDLNEYDDLESEVFADGIIQERGYLDIRLDFDENLQGQVSITVEDPLDIIPDQYAKSYDPDKWQEVRKTRWMSPDELAITYGQEKAEQVVYAAMNERTMGWDSVKFENKFGEDDTTDNSWAVDPDARQIRSVRVLERQFWKKKQVHYFVDSSTGDMAKAPPHWSREQRRAHAAKFKLFLYQTTERAVRWRVVADKHVLHDDWSPYKHFTIVPYFPYFRRGKAIGMVTNLRSPQDQLNKLSSQELHVVNSTANSGWVVEKGAVTNMSIEELAAYGSQTGVVIEHAPGSQPPEKIKPNTIPTGLDRISMKSQANIREISGINDAMLGLEGAEVSGVALADKRGGGQIQLVGPLNNLSRTRRLVARNVLDLVQQFYTEPRLLMITRPFQKPGEDETEQVMINQPTPEGTVLNNITVGKYAVKVSSQPSRDTYNDTQFAEALSLRKEAGVMIPDDRIVEFSNLENKYELADEIREATGRGEVTPEQAAMNAMIQQMQLQTMQLNLMDLEADVRKKHAEIEKIRMETGVIPAELELEYTKLEQQLQIEREGFESRARVVMEQSQNALESIMMKGEYQQNSQMLQALLGPQQSQQR